MKKGLFLLCFLVGCVAKTPAPVVIGDGQDYNPQQQKDMEYDNSPIELQPKPFITEETVETTDIEPIQPLQTIKPVEIARPKVLARQEMTEQEYQKNTVVSGANYVVMKEGDTLYSISKAYGTTVDKLKADNNIVDHTNISTGQNIYIYGVNAKPVYEAKPIEKKPIYNEKTSNAPKPVYNIANDGKFIFPVKGGQIIRKFGENQGGFKNDGINIAASSGDPIKAAANGEVIYIGNELRDYGNLTIIRHNDKLVTSYSHADFFVVSKGDKVKKGDIIGYVGASGAVASSQLHFAVRKNNKAIDPMKYL